MRRVYTAVFRPWYPQYSWFGRDSGLVTEGLRKIGVDSRLVILPSEGMPIDDRFIPATSDQFCDSQFWKSLNLDAVIFQGGGDRGVEPATRAIKRSGTKLLLRLDSDGVVAPQSDIYLYYYNLWWWLGFHKKHPAFLLAFFRTIIKLILPAHFGPSRLASRLSIGDISLIETELAKARLSRVLNRPKSDVQKIKFEVLPIPVPNDRRYNSQTPKERLIVSTARWDDPQKDGKKLIETLGYFLKRNPDYNAIVIGHGEELLSKALRKTFSDISDKIELSGRLSHDKIPFILQRAQIFLCSSRAEGFPNSVGEAVCCGCSVVGPAEIASMHFFASHSSGTLAWTRRTHDFVDAVNAEANAWNSGKRNPAQISAHFLNHLSPKSIGEQLLKIIS
jgi:glycosyltransferase involved in cell wall biosynthesis